MLKTQEFWKAISSIFLRTLWPPDNIYSSSHTVHLLEASAIEKCLNSKDIYTVGTGGVQWYLVQASAASSKASQT